jgi:hypothetical protein
MAKELGFKQGAYKEAVDYFKQKINLPTKRWNSLKGAMHTRAFTVAGAMRADILLDFRNAVDKAISNGDSLQDFRDNFYKIASKWRESDPSFDEKMQKPKYGAWRSKVIYQTNMLTASAAAQERQARELPEVFTHAKYVCMMMPTSREQHKAWNGTVLPVNDPWWEKHSPPNGFGCLCEKEFISKYEMKAGLEKETKAPTPANDTTNIGENWDYSIGDADAENQRLKEQLEEKEEKLFKEYPETRKTAKEEKAREERQSVKEEGGQSTGAKQEAENRRVEIIKQSNERHANRTATEKEKIQAKWTLSHPHSQMPKKFNDANDIASFWNKIDKAKETLGQEKIFQNGDFKYGGVDNQYNGSTEFWNGTIYLDKKIQKLCVSGFEKIRNHNNPSEKECKAICTLWHEMTHNRHKLHKIKTFDIVDGKTVDYMEMANEFVARKTLPNFFEQIGAKKAPYDKFVNSRDNTGYDAFVIRLDDVIDFFKIDKKSFLKQAKSDLFNEGYILQKDFLAKNIAKHVKGMDISAAQKIVTECVEFALTPNLKRFRLRVLSPIKSKLR